MTEKELYEIIGSIQPADEDAMAQARERQANLIKPPGSLGRLEDISVKIAGITGNPWGNEVDKQAILVMSSDNGVVEEGVAVAPQSVTLMQTINMTRRITGVGALAKYFGIQLLVTDLGVKMDIPDELYTTSMLDPDGTLAKKVVNRKIRKGTRNFAKEPAMTREEAVRAMATGIEAVDAAVKAGVQLIGVGEMGIGNTTTGSAVLASLTGLKAEDVTGRGGGLNDEGLNKKMKVINDGVNGYCMADPMDKLCNVGGYDIAAMAGAYLGAAYYKVPVVIDGFISVVAAALAAAFNPFVTDYMFASHKSHEVGYQIALERLGLEPIFYLNMRLGEGSGCPMAFKTIEAACGSMNLMKTFAEGSIDDGYLEEVREGNLF